MENYELKMLLCQMSEKLILMDKCPYDYKLIREFSEGLILLNQYSSELLLKHSKED